MRLAATLLSTMLAAAPPHCGTKSFESSAFTVCPFDAGRQELALVLTDARGRALRGFGALEASLHPGRLAFAMNAGMFDDQGFPIGLYVENGTQRHALNRADAEGNFYMKPNGVFSQDNDGSLHVETTDAFAARGAHPRWATQSGPMLLVAGKLGPPISDDGPSRNIRNGVCVRGPRSAIFAISDDAVSFGRLARLFRDVLHCRNALYLDGVVSSLWTAGRRDARAPLGPMVLVTDR
jgi:uncharacterized protein YigE (DUF2233 family)